MDGKKETATIKTAPAKRIKSADSTSHSSDRHQPRPLGSVPSRVKSAHATLNSLGLPQRPSRQRSGKPVPDEFRTQYDIDFSDSAEAELPYRLRAPLRPSSPTRRNKPHPTETFLRWKVPSGELTQDADLMNEVLKEVERDSKPHFSADYRELAGNEERGLKTVLHTLTRLQLPPTEPESYQYGRHTLKAAKGAQAQQFPDINKPTENGRIPQRKQVVVSRKLLERATQQKALPGLEAWLKTAKPDEQHTVLSLIKAAEAAQVNKQLQQTVKPSAMTGLERWMDRADDREREVAIKLFDRISDQGRTNGYKRSLSAERQKPSHWPRQRSHSVPTVETVGEPAIWHHRSIRDPPPKVLHRGAVFTQPKRYKGEHFSIHPEWPDYI